MSFAGGGGQQAEKNIMGKEFCPGRGCRECHSLCQNLKMPNIRIMLLFLVIIVCGKAWALDQFAGTKCGADIPKSLVGKRDSNERVAALEQRHKDLGLKNLGGTEISDRLFLASWQICGSEYELLVNTKNGLIRDVLLFPHHSTASPMFIGACQADGKLSRNAGVSGAGARRRNPDPERSKRGRNRSAIVVAVLNNSAGYNARDEKLAGTMLKATDAWKIDETKEKFTKQPADNLQCPLSGIVTQDGGP